jgi:hypothetical protein
VDQVQYHVESAAYDHPDQYAKNRHANEPWASVVGYSFRMSLVARDQEPDDPSRIRPYSQKCAMIAVCRRARREARPVESVPYSN